MEGLSMKRNVRRFRAKARKLLRLYSLWHETNRDDLREECLALLGEVLAVEPSFKLRNEFQQAF